MTSTCCTSDATVGSDADYMEEGIVVAIEDLRSSTHAHNLDSTEAQGKLMQDYRLLLQKLNDVQAENAALQERLSVVENTMVTAVSVQFAEASAARVECLRAGRSYLLRHQIAYAVAAFAIGTLITIFPLYGTRQLGLSVSVVGYIMTSGELVGIVSTYYAEVQQTGFILPRPYDLYFILASLGLGLASVPFWPPSLYPGACASVIYVQIINSPSRTVIGECISRLASALDTEQAIALAKANSFRRFGNTAIGISAILTYSASPIVFWWIAAGFILLLIPELKRVQERIAETHVKHDEIMHVQVDQSRMTHAITFIAEVADEDGGYHVEDEENVQGSMGFKGHEKPSPFTMIVLVHVFSIMDAWISRYPFVWFAVQIMAETDDSKLAAICLALYQFCRTISQALQLHGFTQDLHHFLLNFAAIIGYSAMLIALLFDPHFKFWYLMVLPTGLAETLPTQQRCLMDALRIPQKAPLAEKAPIREFVKQTHFGTSVGSALAFVSTAIVYNVLKGDDVLVGIAALGVVVAVLKVLTGVYIAITVGHEGKTFHSMSFHAPHIDLFHGKGHCSTEASIAQMQQHHKRANTMMNIQSKRGADILSIMKKKVYKANVNSEHGTLTSISKKD